MKVRSSVFGSATERSLYKALTTRWSPRLRIYPNLPLLNVIEVSRDELASNEWNFLAKTSLDYTLCNASDSPLMSIEFDGLQEGFSRGAEYLPKIIWTRNPNRKWKFDLKLRICQSLFFPLVIISLDEAVPLGPDVGLAMIDGIIAHTLGRREVQGPTDDLYEEQRDFIEALPVGERDFYIQDIVDQAEVEKDFEWNPFTRELNRIQRDMQDRWPLSESYTHLWDPELPQRHDLNDVTSVQKRMEGIRKATRVGCRVELAAPQRKITHTAWMRNLDGCVYPPMVVQDVARLLAWKKALNLFTAERSST